MKINKIKLYFCFVFLALLWGLSFLGTKIALKGLSPIELLSVRWLLAMLFFIILISTKIIKVEYKGKPVKYLVAVVALQPCIYAVLEAWGINLTTTSESSIFIAIIPLAVCLLARIIFKQKLKKKTVLGVVMAFAGVALCIVPSPDFSAGSKVIGYIALIGAIITGSLYTVLAKRISKIFSPLEITFGLAVGGGIVFNLISLFEGNGFHPYEVFFSGGSMTWSLIYLGLGCSFLAYLIYNYTLSKMPAAIASTIQTNAINIVGVASGIIIAGDPWGWYTIIGFAMIVAGIFISSGEME